MNQDNGHHNGNGQGSSMLRWTLQQAMEATGLNAQGPDGPVSPARPVPARHRRQPS